MSNYMEVTYPFLAAAISPDNTLITEKGSYKGTPCNINVSSIATRIIQTVGRFVERFASDFLIDWGIVEELMDGSNQELNPGESAIVVFAMRRDGVDGNRFFRSRMDDLAKKNGFYHSLYSTASVSPGDCYRSVYAVKVSHLTEEEANGGCDLQVSLHDLTHTVMKVPLENA